MSILASYIAPARHPSLWRWQSSTIAPLHHIWESQHIHFWYMYLLPLHHSTICRKHNTSPSSICLSLLPRMLQRAILLFNDGNLLPSHHFTIFKNHNTPTSSICIFYHFTTPPYLGITTHLLLAYVYLSFLECSSAPSFSLTMAIFYPCTTPP